MLLCELQQKRGAHLNTRVKHSDGSCGPHKSISVRFSLQHPAYEIDISGFYMLAFCNELTNNINNDNNINNIVRQDDIHHLIVFTNVLTPQPTEQFCLYCSNTYGGHCIYTHVHICI